jgi:hypothetical protein
MTIAALASFIVSLLGLLLSTYLERKDTKDASIDTKNQDFREHLAESNTPAVHADLADLHDRVREALCGSAGPGYLGYKQS